MLSTRATEVNRKQYWPLGTLSQGQGWHINERLDKCARHSSQREERAKLQPLGRLLEVTFESSNGETIFILEEQRGTFPVSADGVEAL